MQRGSSGTNSIRSDGFHGDMTSSQHDFHVDKNVHHRKALVIYFNTSVGPRYSQDATKALNQ